jgi:hypothetical protein
MDPQVIHIFISSLPSLASMAGSSFGSQFALLDAAAASSCSSGYFCSTPTGRRRPRTNTVGIARITEGVLKRS